MVTDRRARVIRGGSFDHSATNARSALRYGGAPEFPSFSLGMRPARVITE